MATWLRRMFRPARRIGGSAAARDTDAARAMQTALAEAEEWAAQAAALARVLRETKAAAKRIERSNCRSIPSPGEGRILH
jgi:hypothetical protein